MNLNLWAVTPDCCRHGNNPYKKGVSMKTSESREDYLETILILQREQGNVRSIDVAAKLGFSKPSISRAMSILKKAGYIEIDSSGNIHFTKMGKKAAEDVYERHCLIARYFVDVLNVDRMQALRDACRIEHVISAESFGQIRKWLETHGETEVGE
jgi:Mn-dependent DtxR family transcriptional regulator